MSNLEIWLMYFGITAISFVVFSLVKEESPSTILRAIRTIAAVIGCLAGITFAMVNVVFVMERFFPNLGANSNSSYDPDRDCVGDMFGGC